MEKTDVSSNLVSSKNEDMQQKECKGKVVFVWEPKRQMTKTRFKRRIWKNLIMLSVAFMLNYVSYHGLAALQSSLHVQDGMGTICTSIRYVTLVLSCVFVPPLMIRGIGHKWTISLSFVGFLLWMGANGYGVWLTMVPASIINGFFTAPLWTAQGSYITILATELAGLNGQAKDSQIAICFGVFGLIASISSLFGNIISTFVLRGSSVSTNVTIDNDDIAEICGANYCPWYELEGTNSDPVPKNTVWTLVVIYMVIALSAILISIFFVDRLPQHLVKKSDLTIRQELKTLLFSTSKQAINKKQLLLIPMTMYMGFEGIFFYLEYTRSWVACALGISMIGITTLPFAIMGSIVSLTSGRLVKVTGRIPIFVTGAYVSALSLDIVIQSFLSFWTVDPDKIGFFGMIPLLWGISDAIWVTMSWALYGAFFSDNTAPAFANHLLWWCLGLAIGSGYSNALCTGSKIAIMLAMLMVGMTGYLIAEFVDRTEKKLLVVKEVDDSNNGIAMLEKEKGCTKTEKASDML